MRLQRMIGFFRRYLTVLIRLVPFALAALLDRRRFLIAGPPRSRSEEHHRRRAERMTAAMLDLGPAFIKVGQVLSTRPDVVPPIYAAEFSTLQDEVPEDAGGDPQRVVEAELGDDIDLSTLEPVAGGSLAFVYTAVVAGEHVALKVRRPGIKPMIERDLRVVRALVPLIGAFVDERQRHSLRNVADDFEEIILDELDFEREAEMMIEIGANVDDDRVVVPVVHEEYTSERLLAMEYVAGVRITDAESLADLGVEPAEMATLIATTYLKMGLVDGVFHADPHPGNLAVDDDRRLVIYDFGMSQRLTPAVQAEIVTLYRALVRRDVDELINTLIALDVLDPSVDRTEVRAVLTLVIETLEGHPHVTWRLIVTELTQMLHDFPFRIPPNVMLLIRVGTVAEGVCRSLDPEFDFLAVTRTFLVDHGFIERELRAVIEELRGDLGPSVPALVRAPTRFDRVFGQLERGELVVRTAPLEQAGDRRATGDAVVAGSLFVAASILSLHEQPIGAIAAVVGVWFLIRYLRRSGRGRT